MKKLLLVAVVAVMGVMLLAGGVFAANVTLSATVGNVCGAMSDGAIPDFAIDATSGVINMSTVADGTSPAVSCTNGTTVTVTCPAGGNLTMAGDPTGDIPYTVSCPATYVATGFAATQDIDVGISIAAGAAANSMAGPHIGSVLVTVAN